MIGLGIDAGASSTKWALVDEGEAVLLEGRVGALSGHLFDQAARDAALGILEGLFKTVRSYPPSGAVAGITGLEPESPQGSWYTQAIAKGLNLSPTQVHILGDMDTAYFTHFAPGEGILVYAGTGSNSYHIRADGQVVRAGGRGYIIGDDGAGYAIGRAALRQVIHWQETETHTDQRPLARLLYQAMNAAHWDGIRAYVYGGGRQAVAALAPSVGQAAQESDLAAVKILLQAGSDLADLALLMRQKVGTLPIVITGGALRVSPLIEQSMRSRLPSDVQLEASQKSIAQGAARMALKTKG